MHLNRKNDGRANGNEQHWTKKHCWAATIIHDDGTKHGRKHFEKQS